jgi:hypothetical protein
LERVWAKSALGQKRTFHANAIARGGKFGGRTGHAAGDEEIEKDPAPEAKSARLTMLTVYTFRPITQTIFGASIPRSI